MRSLFLVCLAAFPAFQTLAQRHDHGHEVDPNEDNPYTRKWRAFRYAQYTDDWEFGTNMDQVTMKQGDLKPGYVLIRVAYAAVNPIDLKVMKGQLQNAGWKMDFPMTMGYEYSGFVFDVGDGVTSFKRGDAVFGLNWGSGKHDSDGDPVGGAFAEFIAIPARKVSHRPEQLDGDIAAAVPLVGTTAWQCLDKLQVTRGQKIIIIGGSSAVGQAAVQLAKARGAEVITSCSGRAYHVCDELGADKVLDYWSTKWYNGKITGVDAVLDAVGEENSFENAKKVLKSDGSFISIASVDAGFDPKAHAPLRYAAFFVLSQSTVIQDKLAKMIVNGKLKVRLESESLFRAAGVHIALDHQNGGKSMGKHVIRMEPYMPGKHDDEL